MTTGTEQQEQQSMIRAATGLLAKLFGVLVGVTVGTETVTFTLAASKMQIVIHKSALNPFTLRLHEAVNALGRK